MNTSINLSKFMASNFMLMTFNGRVWQASGKDKKASDENNAAQGAAIDSSYVIKRFFANEPVAAKNKREWDGLRNFFYANTLPYSTVESGVKKGPRLLPSKNVIPFIAEFEQRKQIALAALEDMKTAYPEIIQRSMFNLANMMDIADYPPVSALDSMFAGTCVPSVLAENASISNLAVPANAIDMITSMVSTGQHTAINTAMDDLKKRITAELLRITEQMGKFDEVTKRNAERLKRDGAEAIKDKLPQMHATLISNIAGLKDILESSNVSDSTEVNDICEQLEQHLCAYDMKQVKANPEQAGNKAEVATQLAERLANIDLVSGDMAPEMSTVFVPPVEPVLVDTQEEALEPVQAPATYASKIPPAFAPPTEVAVPLAAAAAATTTDADIMKGLEGLFDEF